VEKAGFSSFSALVISSRACRLSNIQCSSTWHSPCVTVERPWIWPYDSYI